MEKMELMSFKNALKLHFDSIFLFKKRSYSSAFFLSILSQEELGKAYLISDFVYHSRVDGMISTNEELQEWFSLLYRHPIKQGTLLHNSILTSMNPSDPSFKRTTEVFKGKLELLKQNSIYVGLERTKGVVNINGRIKSPLKFSREKSKKQITIINDYLVDLIIGVRIGYYEWDNEDVSKVLTKSLLRKLNEEWLYSNYKIIKRIQRIKQEHSSKKILEVLRKRKQL